MAAGSSMLMTSVSFSGTFGTNVRFIPFHLALGFGNQRSLNVRENSTHTMKGTHPTTPASEFSLFN